MGAATFGGGDPVWSRLECRRYLGNVAYVIRLTTSLCCTNIAPPAVCPLVDSSTDPDGGWHTKACHPVQRVASDLCFDLLAGQSPSV
jgi:hypothetical protein